MFYLVILPMNSIPFFGLLVCIICIFYKCNAKENKQDGAAIPKS